VSHLGGSVWSGLSLPTIFVGEKVNSEVAVLRLIEKHGQIRSSHLMKLTSFAPRTVRYALQGLLRKRLIQKMPCLLDMRDVVYMANHAAVQTEANLCG